MLRNNPIQTIAYVQLNKVVSFTDSGIIPRESEVKIKITAEIPTILYLDTIVDLRINSFIIFL